MILYFCPGCGTTSNNVIRDNKQQKLACKKCGWVGTWDDMIKIETEKD